MTDFDHPLLDSVTGRYACVESRVSTVFLSETLADFLRSVTGAGLVPVVITRPDAWWTFAARYYLDTFGGVRLVRTDAGLLDPFTGAHYAGVTDLGQQENPKSIVDPGAGQELLQAVVSVSVHHSATADVRLGVVAEVLARELGGCEVAAWGVHEPAMLRWDGDAYTDALRVMMPEARTILTGGGGTFQAVSVVRRSRAGIEESITAVTPIGFLNSTTEKVAHQSAQALTQVAESTVMPMIGSVSVLPGWRDGRVPPGPQPLPVPAAILVGPRAVRTLGVDFEALAEQFNVAPVGRKRIPSLVASFDDPRVSPWEQARRIAEVFGNDALTRAVNGERRPG